MAKKAAEDAKQLNISAATVVDALEDIVAHKAKVSSATGKLRVRRKYWLDHGVNLKVLDEMIALKNQDEQDVLDNEVDRARYSAWLNIDLGPQQGELEIPPADPKVKERVIKHDAYQDGFAAGKRGDPRNPDRFGAGTIAQAGYDQGWDDGDSEAFNDAKPQERKVTKGAGPEVTGKRKGAKADAPAPEVPKTAGGDTVN